MDLTNLVNKFKNSILNLGLILLAIIIAKGIYGNQAKKILLLREQQVIEIEKNKVLEEISLSEKKVKVFKDVINKKDVDSIINTVGNFAKDSSVMIISFKPQDEGDYPAYISYSFDLNIAANKYHDIGRFIGALENSNDVYIIKMISMNPQQRDEKTNKITAQLILNTILVKD